jgi:putative copper export protein
VTRFDTFWQYADTWQRSAFIAIMVAAIAQTGFVVVYMLRPWWRHYVGRALLVKSASLLIVLWLTIVNTFVRYPGQEAGVVPCAVAGRRRDHLPVGRAAADPSARLPARRPARRPPLT